MKSITFWPFLVAASKKNDYSTVLYPCFLEEKDKDIIARSAKKTSDENYHINEVKLNTQTYYLMYKSVVGKSSFIEENTDESILKDDCGRTLYLMGGILFKNKDFNKYINDSILNDIFIKNILPIYKQFYNATLFLHAIKSSAIKLNLEIQQESIKIVEKYELEPSLKKDKSFHVRSKQESAVRNEQNFRESNGKNTNVEKKKSKIAIIMIVFTILILFLFLLKKS